MGEEHFPYCWCLWYSREGKWARHVAVDHAPWDQVGIKEFSHYSDGVDRDSLHSFLCDGGILFEHISIYTHMGS